MRVRKEILLKSLTPNCESFKNVYDTEKENIQKKSFQMIYFIVDEW